MDIKINFRAPQDLYERAIAKCQETDITLSQVLRRCLRNWVEDSAPPREPEQEDE